MGHEDTGRRIDCVTNTSEVDVATVGAEVGTADGATVGTADAAEADDEEAEADDEEAADEEADGTADGAEVLGTAVV